MSKKYETSRLLLKTMEPFQAKEAMAFCQANKSFHGPFEPTRDDTYYTESYQQKVLAIEQVEMDQLRMLRLWMYLKDDPSRPIGNFALSNIVRGAFLSCFLGYKMDHRHLRQGYMQEALEKGIDIAFNDLGLHRIEANVMPRNTASLNLTEKLGFQKEGLALKYLKINNRWEDHYHMVLRNYILE